MKKSIVLSFVFLYLLLVCSVVQASNIATGFHAYTLDEEFDNGVTTIDSYSFPNTENFQWLSVSPQGSYLLCLSDTNEPGFYHVENQKFYPLTFDMEKDSNKWLKRNFGLPGNRYIWSEDERYFTFVNRDAAFNVKNGNWALYLGDLKSKSVSVLKTWYPSFLNLKTSGCVYQACFSPTGDKLYFSLVQVSEFLSDTSAFTEEYDIATGKTTRLFSNQWTGENGKEYECIQHGIYCQSNGNIIQAFSDTSSHDMGLRIMVPQDDGWKCYENLLFDDDENLKYHYIYMDMTSDGVCSMLISSSFESSHTEAVYFFGIESNPFAAEEPIFCICGFQDDEYMINTCLSPDGRHALLVHASDTGMGELELLRLEQIKASERDPFGRSYRKINVVNRFSYHQYALKYLDRSYYAADNDVWNGMQWGGNLLLMNTKYGVEVCRFKDVYTYNPNIWTNGMSLKETTWINNSYHTELRFIDDTSFTLSSTPLITGHYQTDYSDKLYLDIDGKEYEFEFHGNTLHCKEYGYESVIFELNTPLFVEKEDLVGTWKTSAIPVYYARTEVPENVSWGYYAGEPIYRFSSDGQVELNSGYTTKIGTYTITGNVIHMRFDYDTMHCLYMINGKLYECLFSFDYNTYAVNSFNACYQRENTEDPLMDFQKKKDNPPSVLSEKPLLELYDNWKTYQNSIVYDTEKPILYIQQEMAHPVFPSPSILSGVWYPVNNRTLSALEFDKQGNLISAPDYSGCYLNGCSDVVHVRNENNEIEGCFALWTYGREYILDYWQDDHHVYYMQTANASTATPTPLPTPIPTMAPDLSKEFLVGSWGNGRLVMHADGSAVYEHHFRAKYWISWGNRKDGVVVEYLDPGGVESKSTVYFSYNQNKGTLEANNIVYRKDPAECYVTPTPNPKAPPVMNAWPEPIQSFVSEGKANAANGKQIDSSYMGQVLHLADKGFGWFRFTVPTAGNYVFYINTANMPNDSVKMTIYLEDENGKRTLDQSIYVFKNTEEINTYEIDAVPAGTTICWSIATANGYAVINDYEWMIRCIP